MKNSIGFVIVAAVLGLGACGGGEEKEGGVTAEESKQLNEAAEMLDASPDSLVAGDETGLGNGEAASGDAGNEAVVDNGAASGNVGNAQ
ncbi:MAG TPA: hypothetical protein VF662_14345 [Allosphingosinicella sp.]